MRDLGNTSAEVRRNAPAEVLRYLERYGDVEEQPGFNSEDIEADFGGGIFIVESAQELGEIETASWSEEHGRYFSLAEVAAVFDVAEWAEPGGEYAVFLLITNNAGGNTYFVPRHIAEANSNATDSILMTEESNREQAGRFGDIDAGDQA
jgi:hypothetical protein